MSAVDVAEERIQLQKQTTNSVSNFEHFKMLLRKPGAKQRKLFQILPYQRLKALKW
jgi:hypothetical protein